jgi:hypothetical protein
MCCLIMCCLLIQELPSYGRPSHELLSQEFILSLIITHCTISLYQTLHQTRPVLLRDHDIFKLDGLPWLHVTARLPLCACPPFVSF